MLSIKGNVINPKEKKELEEIGEDIFDESEEDGDTSDTDSSSLDQEEIYDDIMNADNQTEKLLFLFIIYESFYAITCCLTFIPICCYIS